jgi:phenylacetate-coenzyme A ligase PaaK-like adenylate-forming protein
MRAAMARAAAASGGPPAGVRIAMVAAASPIHATGAAPCILADSPMEFVPVPVTLPLADIVNRLNDIGAPLLYGYPSVLAQLAAERRAGRLRIAPVSVTATSETLRPDLRAAINAGFGVPLANVYGSSEGLVGASAPDEPWLVFADDTCIVELVDEDDRPVPPGMPSSSILVTNLYNQAQPLIRYRIEDRFEAAPATTGDGHLRADVEGRAADVLRFDGRDVHPYVITTRLANAAAVVDYQIRQVTGGVVVDVVAPSGLDAPGLAADIRHGLGAVGVVDADVMVRPVPSLPRDPRTGKLALFVPLAS